MRVAALYDIHGNLPALDAVLAEIRSERIDQIVVGGDVVPGPMPAETLGRLRNLDLPVRWLQGNGDREVVGQAAGKSSKLPEQVLQVIRWSATQLRPEDLAFLAAWPPMVRLEIGALGEVVFCHATPRNDVEIFTERTAIERVAPAFAGLEVGLIVCGHTHMQFDRMVGKVRVINAGSVGMPFGGTGAYWLLLDDDTHLRHTPYDLAEAAASVRHTSYPKADEFAEKNILRPPSAEDMLKLFGPVEMK